MVFEILNSNGLCQFYEIEENAGVSLKGKKKDQYAYLDDEKIVEKLVDFKSEKITKATFHLPQVHCASCIWLLENLYKLNDGILASKVNFLKKEAYITFSNSAANYRKIVELLASIGYIPAINLSDLDESMEKSVDKRYYYQLGVAGFAFGNIMLLSLPEYFGLTEANFQEVFGYLNIILILPVVFYSARDYLNSAWQGLKQKHLNIDVPISLGILTLFGRSLFEIITHTGAGYLDSLAGLVFFLLVGKWFQQTTYHQLSFERDYKSYFPIAATVLKKGIEMSVALSQLKVGDIILLRSGELIPADGILQKGKAHIDYSFVTGESEAVPVEIGEKLFAGGRQTGSTIQLYITKKVAQSYLTKLWNEDTFKSEVKEATASVLANKIGKYFTYAILTIAFVTLAYWLPKDIALAINAFTAVLIIACPCAVALSIPFTFGNALRLLGRSGFYLKNTNIIEQLSNVNTLVFDKTGTITQAAKSKLSYQGTDFNHKTALLAYGLVKQSAHPVSKQIALFLEKELKNIPNPNSFEITHFKETIGQGISGIINGKSVRIEKRNPDNSQNSDLLSTIKGTAFYIDNQLQGVFTSQNTYRKGFQDLIRAWKHHYQLFLLSGDNDKERKVLEKWLPKEHLFFQQSPKNKLEFIKKQQATNSKVVMFGDGLNDAGALQQADIGIVISEDTNNFTPACDAILDAKQFNQLPNYIKYIQSSVKIVYAAYGLAFIYNIIGLSFAVQGTLSPVIAAILMPLSSITIVVFGVGMTYLLRPKRL
jgi:Cu+-exporting ATPase